MEKPWQCGMRYCPCELANEDYVDQKGAMANAPCDRLSAAICGADPMEWQAKCSANFTHSPACSRIPRKIHGSARFSPTRECWSFRFEESKSHLNPINPMKSLLLIPCLGFVLFVNSCRTATPIDPNTMNPSTRCLPDRYHAAPEIHASK